MSDLLRGRNSIRGFVMLHNSPSTYCCNTPAEELLAFLATNVLTTSRDDLHELSGLGIWPAGRRTPLKEVQGLVESVLESGVHFMLCDAERRLQCGR